MLNHRIVSMKGAKAHQVECLTCRESHLFRAHPPGEKPRIERESTAAPRVPRSTVATRAEQVRIGREQNWERATGGHASTEFKPYSVSAVFQEADLLRHKKFGDGVVLRVVDTQKIEVLFRDEARMLAHSLPD
jgi:hypothetical protein